MAHRPTAGLLPLSCDADGFKLMTCARTQQQYAIPSSLTMAPGL